MYSALLLHHLHTFLQVEPIQILTHFCLPQACFTLLKQPVLLLTLFCFVFLKHNKKKFLLYLVVPKPLFVFLRPFLEANISSIFFGFDFLHTALN